MFVIKICFAYKKRKTVDNAFKIINYTKEDRVEPILGKSVSIVSSAIISTKQRK